MHESLVPSMRAVDPQAGIRFETIAAVPAFLARPDDPAVQLAQRLAATDATTLVAFGTEAGLFQGAGIPTVVCGPGHIAQAHQADEYVSLAQLAAAERFLLALVDGGCRPCCRSADARAAALLSSLFGEQDMSREIGWIGLGRMGEAMVKRLTQAGSTVKVWNRTRSKAEPMVEYGATIVDARQDLVGCDVVFTMVSTTDDLKDVLFGDGGLVTGATRPAVVVDSSSISNEGSAEIRARLEALGVGYLCAPVSGNAKVAKAGKLLVVASGPKAVFDRVEPLLQALGRKVLWVGEGELARIWKIAHNTMFGVVIQNLCEITVLAEKAGIPRHVFLESINDSVLGSMYTRYKTPVLTNLTFEQVTFTPKLLLKDMDLGLGAAKALRRLDAGRRGDARVGRADGRPRPRGCRLRGAAGRDGARCRARAEGGEREDRRRARGMRVGCSLVRRCARSLRAARPKEPSHDSRCRRHADPRRHDRHDGPPGRPAAATS